MFLTTSLLEWHASFDSQHSPCKILDFSQDAHSSECLESLYLDSAHDYGDSHFAATSYDTKLFKTVESWYYPLLFVYVIMLPRGEYKRILVAPNNRIAYDPHPIWLNALGLLNEKVDPLSLISSASNDACQYSLHNSIIAHLVHEMPVDGKVSMLSFGSFNYSHFLIDTLSELSVNRAIADRISLKIFDMPIWSAKISRKIGFTRVELNSQSSLVRAIAFKNIIISHVPSYRRRGIMARSMCKPFTHLGGVFNSARTGYLQCCFLARASDEMCRVVNQAQIIQWCLKRGVTVLYPSKMSITQKRRIFNRFSYFISDGGSSVNNVLLFAHRLKGCISIVPRSFIDSPYHCLGGMQYLGVLASRLLLSVHTCSKSAEFSGPVDSVFVDLIQIEAQLLRLMSSADSCQIF